MIANSQSPTVRCKCLLRRRLHQQARAAELLGMRRRRARLRDHVVDEAVLVPDAGGLVLSAVALALVHVLEDLQEAPVVLLQDRVLGAQVQRPARRGRPRRSPAASAWARPARHPPPPAGALAPASACSAQGRLARGRGAHHCLVSAYSKHDLAKPRMDFSVLYLRRRGAPALGRMRSARRSAHGVTFQAVAGSGDRTVVLSRSALRHGLSTRNKDAATQSVSVHLQTLRAHDLSARDGAAERERTCPARRPRHRTGAPRGAPARRRRPA